MKIGIIGGGMMGMALAYRLIESGHSVHILEAGEQVGGLATWFDYGDFIWDKYYHVILTSDSYLLSLIDEMGLTEKIHWTHTKTGFLWKGRHLSMSNYWEFLTFPALTLWQKGRLGAGLIYAQMIRNPEYLERMTAPEWLKKVFGKGVYKAIWEPLLKSKFGVLKDKVPATIIWAVITRYSSTRSKKGGKEWMGHLQNTGLKVLFDALSEKINNAGGKISCNTSVVDIDDSSSEGIIVKTNQGQLVFDRLMTTLPTQLTHKIGPQLKWESERKGPPKFLGVIRLALVLKRSLSRYYVTNLIDDHLPFTGIIELSALTNDHEMGDHKMVMIPRYDVPESPWFTKSEEEIRNIFINAIKPIWPDIEENIIRSYVHSEKIVQALWIDGPPQSEEPNRTQNGKIWSVNAELAGRDVLNNNAIVRVANGAAKQFIKANS